MTSLAILLVAVVVVVNTSTGSDVPTEDLRKAFYRFFEANAPVPKDSPQTRGKVQSCGPPDANFTLEWSPKVIDPDGTLTVYYNYTLPHDFHRGIASFKLYYDGIKSPVFEQSYPVGCQTVGKYIPCPAKAGYNVQGKHSLGDLLRLVGYGGGYKAYVNLTNENNKVMFCAKAEATIK